MAYALLAFAVLVIGIWLRLRFLNGFWKRLGVPFVQGTALLGNMKDVVLLRKPFVNVLQDVYNSPVAKDSAAVGINIFLRPGLLLRDLDLIKAILVKDFAAFSNRQVSSDIHNDMIGGGNLFFVKNPSWKRLRARLTPIFTSGKLKQMFGLMTDVADELNDYLLSVPVNEKTKMFREEFKLTFSRYLVDMIATCAFGIKANSMRNPNNEFCTQSRKMFTFTFYRAIEFTSVFFIPGIVPWFKFKTFGKDSNDFLRESIKFAIDNRIRTGEVRNDLIDTLLALRNEDEGKPFSTIDIVFEGDALVAQAAVFFAAGFETTSTVMSCGLYELSRQTEVQRRIRAELKGILDANNGELTYDAVFGMQYLGMVISEVLRLYPSVPFLDRECTLPIGSEGYDLQSFSIDFKIPPGMPILIPVHAIHKDPRYWPKPELFDPERFSPENKDKIIPYTYLPFGTGPHSCIGDRFGQLQTRLGFINFFRNHRVTPCELTLDEPRFDKFSVLIQMDGGVHLNVIRDPL